MITRGRQDNPNIGECRFREDTGNISFLKCCLKGSDIIELDSPYPGSNIFSLASGGAIYVRDPYKRLVEEQLNGGEFVKISESDWKLILPYLEENEKLFGIDIKRLLTVEGKEMQPGEVYRKIRPKRSAVAVDDDGLSE